MTDRTALDRWLAASATVLIENDFTVGSGAMRCRPEPTDTPDAAQRPSKATDDRIRPCTPENPCDAVNGYHVLLFGNCFTNPLETA